MKFLSKTKAAVSAAALLGMTQLAMAGSFDNVNSNGQSIGKMAKSAAGNVVDMATLLEAGLYIGGIFFIVMFIMTLVKWKKSDGREGNAGLIAVYLIAGVFCVAAPTLMGGGISTLFGSGSVSTVKAPSASFTGN